MNSVAVWLIALVGTCFNIQFSVAAVHLRDMDHFIKAVQQSEDSNPGLTPLALVRSLRRTAGHDDALTRHFLGASYNVSDSNNNTEALELFLDKAIHHFVTDTGKERGVVLAPDGTTVALAPLLLGIEIGQRAKVEGTPHRGLHSLTLATTLGLSFLRRGNSSSAERLGPDGCWDNVTSPMVFTLSGTPSLATDALINGGMDGAILGKHLSGPGEPHLKLSEVLRVYYSHTLEGHGLDSAPRLISRLRRRNFGQLLGPSLLQEKVLEALKLSWRLKGMEGEVKDGELEKVVKEGVQEFVHRYIDCPPVIPRCQWGAEPTRGVPITLSPPLPFLYIHHTETPDAPCLNFQRCSRDMRAMQRFHQVVRGWQDIGYSFVAGSDGYLYEGRGWRRQGTHTRGHNSFGYGVAFIGNYNASLPSQYTMELVRHGLARCAVSAGFLQANYTLHGHRQVVNTTCPGEALFSEIRGWEQFKERIASEQKRRKDV